MKNSLQSYLKENAHHGTAAFPVGFYSVRFPEDTQNMPIHWHEEMEFTLVRSGSVCYSIDLVDYELGEGDILLISPDTLHSAHQKEELSACTDSIVFHFSLVGMDTQDACTERYIRPIYEGQIRIPAVVHPGEPFYEELLNCFLSLWPCHHRAGPYRELLFKAEVLRLIHLVWQVSSGQIRQLPAREARMYEDKLKVALAYMQAHYAEPITVKELADQCGFSQVHFMNIFKAALGSTCIEYLIEYRLAFAAIDLKETDHSIMQVAMDNGFQNISYFNRIFKKRYHCTPSAYRRARG
ncbi:MAG: helix-turn-helix domain-containing protein [Oscillospiraceae bacterium]|nr:helix-turn-helix domain-containing protein [Oscillospiraceae bacterium]